MQPFRVARLRAGRATDATPTLFRHLRKRVRSFRPTTQDFRTPLTPVMPTDARSVAVRRVSLFWGISVAISAICVRDRDPLIPLS